MKNILVTGGAGYIGSHIIELLLKKNFKVFIIDNLSTGHKKLINKKAKFFKVDISKKNLIKKIIKKNNIDSVIHLAAKLNVREAEKKPKFYFKNNVGGTLNLLQICKNQNVRNFLFSSSCAVYSDKVPYATESSEKNPKGVYGQTKLKCEKIVKKYFKGKNRNYGILRYFNVVGASPSKKIGQINKNGQLFKNFSIAVKKKKPIFNIYGKDYNTFDGTCIRDYIHVYDIADIHLKVLLKMDRASDPIILNCGYGKGLSVLEVANSFKKFSKNEVKIIFGKKRKGEMVKIVANVKKLKKNLNWKPRFHKLNKMIKSSIEWEKKLN
tara:strand:- start:1722 stop:2693 length:972 start_codon:yes stop_codon:yes gene_type:complete